MHKYFFRKTKAAALVEYVALMALISVSSMFAIMNFGQDVSNTFDVDIPMAGTEIVPFVPDPAFYFVPVDPANPTVNLVWDPTGGGGGSTGSGSGSGGGGGSIDSIDGGGGGGVLMCAPPGFEWTGGGYRVPGIVLSHNRGTQNMPGGGPNSIGEVHDFLRELTGFTWWGEDRGYGSFGHYFWGRTMYFPPETVREPGEDGCTVW